MRMKLSLFSFIAVCLLPCTVISQGFCGLCNPSCNVKLDGADRKLEFYNDALYYFDQNDTKSGVKWNEANSACTGLFKIKNGWPGRSGNLASLENREEFDFIVGKMKSYSIVYSFIGGILVGSEWKWTDGTSMNKALIEGPDRLWSGADRQPSGGGENAMEARILQGSGYINDVGQNSNNGRRNYVCKIPCSSGNPCSAPPKDLKPECNAANHNILDEASRLVTTSKSGGFCDHTDKSKHRSYTKLGKWKGSGWYRFTGDAGTRMIDQNDPKPVYGSCGSWKAGYISGSHPASPGQTIQAKICFSGMSTCTTGGITNCGSYFVYKLPETPAHCSTRYCGTFKDPTVVEAFTEDDKRRFFESTRNVVTMKKLLDQHPDLVYAQQDFSGIPQLGPGWWSNGFTALHKAAHYGYTETTALLLQNMDNIETKSKNGGTALHEAARNGQIKTTRMLLEKNANIEAKDNEGQTPLDRAKKRKHTDVVKLLVAYGARP